MPDDAAPPGGESSEQRQTGKTENVDAAAEAVADVTPATCSIPIERVALVAGLIVGTVLAGLVGWLGFRVYEADAIEAQRSLFVQTARQGAVNLSTIDYEHADADAQRILDSATGKFYDNFSHRMQSYVENAKRTRSKLAGSVIDAGLQSQTGDRGRVLVAVTVRSSSADPAQVEQQPALWRMQITVQKTDNVGKISDVVFVS
jgi:Mce-associated membrane protein